MTTGVGRLGGLKFRFKKWHFRIWLYGFEYGNNLDGRVRFFPWHRLGSWRRK